MCNLFNRKTNPCTSAVEFEFFTEICEMMGVLNGTCKDISSICTLLYQLLECVLLHDIYQVGNTGLIVPISTRGYSCLVQHGLAFPYKQCPLKQGHLFISFTFYVTSKL